MNIHELSDGCDINRVGSDEDDEDQSSSPELPQHEKFNQELSSIVSE